MGIRKEIIILNGGGHKGVVKVYGVPGKDGSARINCALDFRPSGANLYLIGDDIAEIKLKDVNYDGEVAFRASSDIGCVLRSSSLTMFGGKGVKSEMLKKIDDYNADKARASALKREEETAVEQARALKEEKVKAEQNVECQTERNDKGNTTSDAKSAGRERFADVEAKTYANPLGEWTKYDGNNFYYAIKPQIDEMFICYPKEETLCSVVPNSDWVRVDAEDGYYVVGLLFDAEEPSFICYGVPHVSADGGADRRAPAEIENMCVWLPVNADGSKTDGYWVIYQSAKTGEIIK